MEFPVVAELVRAVEMKDVSTAAHTWRVALYAMAMAEAYNVPLADRSRIVRAAVLHDIGKVDVPDHILQKPGRLTDDEYEQIKRHTTLGFDRLKRMGEQDELALALVRSHHERLDGSGYPDGLAGDAIPQVASTFAVIDTFDAMTSIRPYRRRVGRDAAQMAIDELKAKAGVWYDPKAVSTFSSLYDRGALDWIMRYYNDAESVATIETFPWPEAVRQAQLDYAERVARGDSAPS